ncbi:YciI family protein [Paractinoplanes brasiliensis]|uniref:Uncharacterized protein YciI n=1 Tax=Paractinoplanes brasiliensis TaxID=52695 RepID=A0A4R6JXH0_9ACTN|nr:YciI family protein [Actinoplanes brasiliensis]TDO39405.1 uncharacterized protein YciI [Actinoplanes brasiliensis]GID32695.1 hypothetical protein Abr02nite_76780 [Actinoplanes brasiliensis]
MISKYLAPLEQVDAVREAHLAFLEGLEAQNLVVTAGRQDPPNGGVVVLNVEDEARAWEIMAGDPYVVQNLAEYTATGWVPARGALKDYPKA